MEVLSRLQLKKTMDGLTEKQKGFLENRLKIRRRSQWLQILANFKAIDITDEMSLEEIEDKIDDWILIDCLDGGYKRRPYKCDCGQALRFQYIIQNKKKGEVRKLGEHCFEKYLSLPASVIKDVKSGLYTINLERDEILTKLHKRLFFPLSNYLHLNIPQEIIEQFELALPLTDSQIRLVEKININYKEEKKLSRIFDCLSIDQKAYVSRMNQRDRRELLLTMEDGVIVDLIPDEEIPNIDESIKKHIELQLPLLEKQQERIKEFKINKRRKQFLNGLTEEQMSWFVTFSNGEQEEIIEKYNAPLFYSVKQVKALSLSEEMITQVQLNFPLLKRHFSEIQTAKLKMNEYRNRNGVGMIQQLKGT